jgi:hypothetical protein
VLTLSAPAATDIPDYEPTYRFVFARGLDDHIYYSFYAFRRRLAAAASRGSKRASASPVSARARSVGSDPVPSRRPEPRRVSEEGVRDTVPCRRGNAGLFAR